MNKIQFFLICILSLYIGQSLVHAGGAVEKKSYAFPTELSQYQLIEEEYSKENASDSKELTLLEASELWARMRKLQKGKIPPQVLSTHPSPSNRIRQIKLWIPEIKSKFPNILKLSFKFLVKEKFGKTYSYLSD